jgi:hypothetical protein
MVLSNAQVPQIGWRRRMGIHQHGWRPGEGAAALKRSSFSFVLPSGSAR